ncbi:heat-shock protein, partial [Thioclava sp. BHET1]
ALADHVRVNGATHADGMLHIDLVRETPEALKPRRIEIARPNDVEARAVEAATV